MKNYLFICILSLFSLSSLAQKTGYDIKIRFTEATKDNKLFLCRYFGKGFPEVYKVDSATVNSKGEFHFKKSDDFLGGMYIVLYNNNSMWYDIVMYNGMKLDLTIDPKKVQNTIVKGSKENSLNLKYLILSEEYGEINGNIRKKLETATSHDDSLKVYKEIESKRDEFVEKRDKIAAEAPNSLFSKIIQAIDKPTPPSGIHYKDDGTVDSFYSFYYVKNNYWNNFDFTEERLIHTPLLEPKLKDYFDNYVIPKPDTFQLEADILIALSRSSPEIFKFTLHYLTNYARTSKYMGMDESFVYLVNKYYRAGDAFWLDSTTLHKNYLNVADDLDKTKLGLIAPNLKLRDAYNFNYNELKDLDADYTILVFWDITCGLCLTEIPAIDSMYNALDYKNKNIKIYSVPTAPDGSLESLHKVIDKLNVKKDYWHHTIDTDGTSRAKQLYGITSSPQIFILDKDKKIIGKKIRHDNIPRIIEISTNKVN